MPLVMPVSSHDGGSALQRPAVGPVDRYELRTAEGETFLGRSGTVAASVHVTGGVMESVRDEVGAGGARVNADATPAIATGRGRVRVESGAKRIRTYLAGRLVVDTVHPMLVWEVPYYPAYYLPRADVRAELVPTGENRRSPSRGVGLVHDVRVAGVSASGAALLYPDSPIVPLRELVRFEWGAMDEWMEEDEPVYTHPRDPYTRVDILASSRHVQVEVDGVVVADSRSPRILFETGLPPRYYLPLQDVRMDLVRQSEAHTGCPYKGTASYFHLELGGRRYEDFAWIYRYPLPESQKIAGLVAFYNEKVDLRVDGVLLQRPHTKFS
jgi:uncharacterized protein (DUF427 family)